MSKARLLSSDCRPVALHFHLLNSYSPTTYAQFTSPLVQLPNLCAHIQATERGGSCCALAVSIPSPLTLSTMSYANCRTQTKCLHAGKLTSTPLESFFLLCASSHQPHLSSQGHECDLHPTVPFPPIQNTLPTRISMAASLTSFRNLLKCHLLQNPSLTTLFYFLLLPFLFIN